MSAWGSTYCGEYVHKGPGPFSFPALQAEGLVASLARRHACERAGWRRGGSAACRRAGRADRLHHGALGHLAALGWKGAPSGELRGWRLPRGRGVQV